MVSGLLLCIVSAILLCVCVLCVLVFLVSVSWTAPALMGACVLFFIMPSTGAVQFVVQYLRC